MKNIQGIKKLIKFLFRYKGTIILLLISSVLIALASLVPPQLLAAIIDYLSGVSLIGFKDVLAKICQNSVTFMVLTLPILNILIYVSENIYGYQLTMLGNRIINDLREAVFDNILKLKNISDLTIGNVITVITGDTEAVTRAFVGPMNGLLTNVLKMVITIVIFMVWNWKLALVTMIFIPFVYYLSKGVSLIAKDIAFDERNQFTKVTDNLKVTFDNFYTIKNLGGQEHETMLFQKDISKIYQLRQKLSFEFLKYWPKVMIMQQIAILCTMFIALQLIGDVLKPSDLMVVYMYLNNVYQPLISLSRFANDIFQADASLKRVFDLIEKDNYETTEAYQKHIETLEVDHLSLGYNRDIILNNISFEANKDELVVLIGRSGIGKSTILNAFAGISEVHGGRIMVNHQDVYIEALNHKVRICFSNPQIFNRTFKENIAYPNRIIDDDQMKLLEALNLSGLEERFENSKNILSNPTDLSSGEKRRIALFRTISEQADIYIIDEPTAELDEANRNQVIDILKKLKGIKLVITHDSDLVNVADRIVEIK